MSIEINAQRVDLAACAWHGVRDFRKHREHRRPAGRRRVDARGIRENEMFGLGEGGEGSEDNYEEESPGAGHEREYGIESEGVERIKLSSD